MRAKLRPPWRHFSQRPPAFCLLLYPLCLSLSRLDELNGCLRWWSTSSWGPWNRPAMETWSARFTSASESECTPGRPRTPSLPTSGRRSTTTTPRAKTSCRSGRARSWRCCPRTPRYPVMRDGGRARSVTR